MNQNSALAYLDAAQGILDRIRTTQLPNIEAAADICTQSMSGDGLVHLFGTGHSRMFVEEMFPRHGSFSGFHSMVELSLTFHNQVVGSNGQRQAMFLEKVEGLGKMIMRNFVMGPPDNLLQQWRQCRAGRGGVSGQGEGYDGHCCSCPGLCSGYPRWIDGVQAGRYCRYCH